MEDRIRNMAKAGKAAARKMAAVDTEAKNHALMTIARVLDENRKGIQAENGKDLVAAREKGLSSAMIDRLTLSDTVIDAMIQGLSEVAALPDPIGEIREMTRRPNGLEVGRMRIPLGVIAMIFESRPNVVVDAAALCLKAGNGVILRGGSEAHHSNNVLADTVQQGLKEAGLPEAAVQVLPMTDRAAVPVLLKQQGLIDLVIPRGGEGLIRLVTEQSRIPVLKHYKGVCHVYVDDRADLGKAVAIAVNAKAQRPGVCNAMETLLVHEGVADEFLGELAKAFGEAGVEIRGCEATCRKISGATPATEEDWPREYLDLVCSVKVVVDMDGAMDHIATYNSGHSESIVTEDWSRARRFLREVDASVVLANASTRFNDGGQLGLGAEIGISTDKLHAYGPMGLKELTTEKFIVFGDGQIRP